MDDGEEGFFFCEKVVNENGLVEEKEKKRKKRAPLARMASGSVNRNGLSRGEKGVNHQFL